MSVKRFVFSLIFIVAALVMHGTTFAAAPARTLGFNGQLFDGASPLTGSVNATFTFYDAASGGNVTGSPIAKTVTVNKGYFNTQFSEADLSGVNFDQSLFLQVNINGTDLSPRSAITSSASALKTFGAFSYVSEPAVGTAGSLYFNITSNTLFVSNGTSWITGSSSPWTVNGSDIGFVGGKVGIGTTTPTAKLSVNGTFMVSSSSASFLTSMVPTPGTAAEQPLFQSSQGYFSFKHGGTGAPRMYLMPNGAVSGTTAKFELFNTDFMSDSTNYNGFNVFTTNVGDEIHIGANQNGTANRLKMIIGGNYVASSLQSNSPKIEFNTDNTLAISASALTLNNSTGESLRVASNGKVSIGGLLTPASRLNVYEDNSATSNANGITIEQDGTGDAMMHFLLTATQRYAMGIDNSDGDKFKIGTNQDLNSNNLFTLTTAGSVGIGTTSPVARLTVVGESTSTEDMLLVASSSGATLFSVSPTGRTVINRSREVSPVLAHSDNQGGFHLIGVPGNQNTLVMYGTGNANNVLVGYAHSGTASVPAPTASGNFLMRMVGGGYTGSAFTGKAEVAIIASETWSSTSTGAYITFRTTANGQTTTTEKMRVDSNGFVGIGTTTPTASLHASGTIRFSSLGAGTLSTDSLGNVTVSSDERLKNIQGMFTTGLEKIKALSPILYRWKSETGYDTENSYAGFSAQNVQESIPEAVSTDGQGHLTLSDRPILAALVNAIKELATTMDGFADKLATKFVDAEKVKAKDIETEKLCIKNTCVTEEQLQVLMLSSGQAVGAQTQPTVVVDTPQATTTATSTESVATTTEAVVPVVEATPTPEVVEVTETEVESAE